jgi:hypothetical protein
MTYERVLSFNVTSAVMKALRLIAKDSGEDADHHHPSVVALMAPNIAAELLEGALIDAIRDRYDKGLGDL